jgi:hypothetical protein
LVDDFASRLGDTPTVREAVRTIVDAAQTGNEPDSLPDFIRDAYRQLNEEVGLPRRGVAAPPGEDGEAFNAEEIYQDAKSNGHAAPSFGFFRRDTLLAPLRALSFWKMKDRARRFGEQGVHPFLESLQKTIDDRDVRLHLIGHSFGCIVASAAVAGEPQPARAVTVDSLCLLQGALSLWSYSESIPDQQRLPGYFNRLIKHECVRGPIVTTRSDFDTAVGVWYPRAAGVARQVAFALAHGSFPKYGGIGSFGIQGSDLNVSEVSMLPLDGRYTLATGRIFNVDSSQYVNAGTGWGGAHSDIRKPEVAHLVWEAMLASDTSRAS